MNPNNNNNGAVGSNKPRFSTILVARANNARPSDVEVHLRQHCQKMRVVSGQALNGAHMIFPQEHSLALRIYTALDVQKLDQQQQRTSGSSNRKTAHDDVDKDDDAFDDDDGILAFTRKFRWTLVFFVLDAEHFGLLHTSPFVQGALRLTDAAMMGSSSSSEDNKQHHHPPRIVVVASTEQVLSSLTAFADALRPHRFAKREAHVRTIRSQQNNRTEAALRAGIATAVRGWADRQQNDNGGDENRLPAGEADVLLRCLNGSVAAVAAADARVLANIPVEDRTKRLLLQFFAAAAAAQDDDDDPMDEAQEGEEKEASEHNDAALLQSTLVSPPFLGENNEGENNDVGVAEDDAAMMQYENVGGVDTPFYKDSSNNNNDVYNDNFTALGTTQNDFGPPPATEAYPEPFEAPQGLQPSWRAEESYPLTQQFRGDGPYHQLQQPNRNAAAAYPPPTQDYYDQYSQAQQPPPQLYTPSAPRADPQWRAPGYPPPRAQQPQVPWGTTSSTTRRQPQPAQPWGWNSNTYNNHGTATPFRQQQPQSSSQSHHHPNNHARMMTTTQLRRAPPSQRPYYPPHNNNNNNNAMPAMRRYM